MHIRYGFNCVQPIKFIISAWESFGEGAIAGVKFIRHFVIHGDLASIIHVVGAIDWGTYVKSVLGVFDRSAGFDGELCGLSELSLRGYSVGF